ncbi:hypothetical protein [Pseudofrankia sp. BMG5.37]|nr:hypothetical protein [Pseudofrankia sp. BMG5.37]MDT3438343.1 hypothetical protein [Pseudofrankia sp. BMG5.37]
MATATLRPNATTATSWTVTGGPSAVHAALADDEDGTYAAGPEGLTQPG